MNARISRLPGWAAALSALTLATPLILLTGCEDDATEPDPTPTTGTVVLQFDAAANGGPLELGEGHAGYVNAAGNRFWVSNLEYIVSDFTLESEVVVRDGERNFDTGADVLHYRTHADTGTRSFTLENVPAGDYSHLHFHFGIGDMLNVTGGFPAMDLAGMAWPAMQGGGYHYMRHEGDFVTATTDTIGFTTHTGPTGGVDYSIEVEVDLDLDTTSARHAFEVPAGGTVTVTLEMNVDGWYATPNTYDLNDYGPIMGNAAAQSLLMANGAEANGTTVWSVTGITTQ